MKYLIYTISILLIFSCKKKETVITPTPKSTTVSFATDVMAVFNKNNCNGPYCHGSGGVPGIAFGNYTEINAISSVKLIGAINHSSGFDTMPRSAAKLAQFDIDIIETWINEGKNNN